MARRKRAVLPAHAWAREQAHAKATEIAEMSDEEIGHWLARLAVDPMIEVMATLPDAASKLRIRQLWIDGYLQSANRPDDSWAWHFGTWHALNGRFRDAGQVFRNSPALKRVVAEQQRNAGRGKGRETATERADAKRAEWRRVGLAIRNKETGEPMHDNSLAEEIERKCARTVGGKAGSIRGSLKSLGLDRKTWLARKPVKRPRSKLGGKKLRTFGSLRR